MRSPSLQRVLDAMVGAPACVHNDRLDFLAANRLGYALYSEMFADLIGELSTRSDDFRTRWASHNVRYHRTGIKTIHHPIVGDLDLSYEGMELPADARLMLFVYSRTHRHSSRGGSGVRQLNDRPSARRSIAAEETGLAARRPS